MEVLVLQYNMQTVSPQEGMSYLMHDELSDQVELASDLEWLLLNDRAKADELLMHLVVDYGAGLNLLMQSLFADPSTVEEAMVETLVQIVLQRDRYQTDQAVKVWLYSFALDTAWRLRRRWKWGMIARNPKEHNTWPSFNQMDGIPGWMEYLPEQTRLVTVLQRYIGLEQNEIAQVLGTPVFSIVQTLAVVDRIFPPESSQHKLKLNTSFQQHLLEVTLPSAMENQPEGKLSRNLLEISWVIGAVCIIALLTRIYDLVNPDLVRQAVEFSFLTPLPTLTREPMPTATSLPWLDMSDSPEEIALRYWQRWLHVDTIWIDYLIMLGGAQGGINGYSLSRVELAWDMQTGNRMILVGPPEGPPAYGLYSNNNNTYEFPIRYGRLAETTIINNSRPSYWF